MSPINMVMLDNQSRKLNEAWKSMCEVQTEIEITLEQYSRKIQNASEFFKKNYMETMIQQATDKIANKFNLDEMSKKEINLILRNRFSRV